MQTSTPLKTSSHLQGFSPVETAGSLHAFRHLKTAGSRAFSPAKKDRSQQYFGYLKTVISSKILGAVLFAFVLFFAGCQEDTGDKPDITHQELKDHVDYLASDARGGRYPGSEGGRAAGDYIRQEFKRAGLKLLGEDGFQRFQVQTGKKTGSGNWLRIDGDTAKLGKDFNPMPFSGNGQLSDSVVFAGYGVKNDSRRFSWNSYRGLNPRGRWVMVLRGAPQKERLKKFFMGQGDERKKALQARDLGASGILFVSGEGAGDELVKVNQQQGSIGIPAMHISREMANKILATTTVSELEKRISRQQKPQPFRPPVGVDGACDLITVEATARNVIGQLRSGSPGAKDRYILIGGHYDHLGMGGENTGSRRPDTMAVHNGADDNASGVAALMEIAEKLAPRQDSLQRHFLFVAFDAEEMGLIGSRHFTRHAPVPLDSIEAMINLDMIGRLRHDNSLQIGGTGTSPIGEELLHQLNQDSTFNLGMTPQGYGPSDHAAFYSSNIPVFFISTGPHLDYHTPADDPDQLNYPGLKKVADFVFRLTNQIASRHQRLAFREAGPKQQTSARHGEELKATLGIMPDFAGVVEKGLRADLVIEGKPADRAGMKKGDVITAINGKKISDIYDYMDRMSEYKPGQTITVEVRRGQQQKVLMVQL